MLAMEFDDPELGGETYFTVIFPRKVLVDGKEVELILDYPKHYFDEIFIRNPHTERCEYRKHISLGYESPETCLNHNYWIAFHYWFHDLVVLKTDDSDKSIVREKGNYRIVYNSLQKSDKDRFKMLVWSLFSSTFYTPECERKKITMLKFLVINWPERLKYQNSFGFNLLHFAAEVASPNIIRAFLQLADKYYGNDIKDFFISCSRNGLNVIMMAKGRKDKHRDEIVLLLEEYFSFEFLFQGNISEKIITYTAIVLQELLVYHHLDCESLIDLFLMMG
jgi:hypothetical protein